MKTGEVIKKRRLELGYTQKQLAEMVGYTSVSTINKIESGKIDLTQRKIKRFSDVLGVDVKNLFPDVPQFNRKEGLLTIPFVNQKASAGFWEEELPSECINTRTIDILPVIAGGQDRKSLLAIQVSGDSMVDENLCDGDIVVFSKGRISGDGLYVLVIGTTVAVKRVEFDPINNKIRVCSANRQKGYEPVVLANEEGTYRILGKVTGWIHGNHN